MDNLLLYLLKVSAGTALFYLCYLFLFRKDTFYRRNRIFLILTLLLPTILPALKIPVISNSVLPVEPVNPIDNLIFSGNSFETTMAGTINSDSFDFNSLFKWIYFTIAGLLLLRAVISLISTYRIIKKGAVKTSHFPKLIIIDNQLPPFSFFPYAVIPAEDYKSRNYINILDHEFAHIRQGHTFDLLLSELFIAFQWFNPFVWLIKRSILLNHEYLADNVSLKNKSVKEYQYMLLNFQTGLKNVSLVHSFNSLIKNRIIMINKKPTRKYASLKNILILPLVLVVVYAFATPEYHYVAPVSDPLTIYKVPEIMQKGVKGIVLNEEGKPLEGVNITSTGTMGNAFGASTDQDGRFSIANVQSDASLLFFCRGYKPLTLKPDFSKEMSVKMGKDPEYKASATQQVSTPPSAQKPNPLVVVDGVISGKNYTEVAKELGYNRGISKMIMGKEATDKYGEKGANGVYEITTRKKALEMGLKPPFPRLAPEDYPTFQNQRFNTFSDWVTAHADYPAEAKEKRLEGWVTVNFRVELDGTVSNVVSTTSGVVDPVMVSEIIRVVQSAPKWESPKNTAVDEPFSSGITVRFKLPDQILNEAPFVVVEQMPLYPGGDVELLNFIKNNTKYPEAAKTGKIEGSVIIRFIVNTEGNVEGVSILKGVHPLLDAEAVRVISGLTGFRPGMQGGKPVNVWYMAPVNFSLSAPEPLFSKTSISEVLKFIGENTAYPQEAKVSSDTGRVFVVVKLEKGGIIKDCKAFTEKTGIKVPFLPEVIIVAYKSSTSPGDLRPGKTTGNGQIALQTECVRVANKLSVNEIPDWKDKNMEFALTFIFVLK